MRRGETAQLRDQLALGSTVHSASWFIEQNCARPCAAEDHREREPLALPPGDVARMARGKIGEPVLSENLWVNFVVDALVN